jgi:hypothetical protein
MLVQLMQPTTVLLCPLTSRIGDVARWKRRQDAGAPSARRGGVCTARVNQPTPTENPAWQRCQYNADLAVMVLTANQNGKLITIAIRLRLALS